MTNEYIDIWDLLRSIKNYTNKHSGFIFPKDKLLEFKYGFEHTDGTVWEIRITDVQRSLSIQGQLAIIDDIENNYTENILHLLQTKEGKEKLCKILSFNSNPGNK